MASPTLSRAMPFDPSALPIGQLESAKFKISQIMESIVALQRIVEAGGQNAMPSWPDILTKYNVLLSQTHNLTMSLVSNPGASQQPPARAPNGAGSSSTQAASVKQLAKLALHPSSGLRDAQLDNDLIPLLRNQQTSEVLRLESDTARKLSERLPTVAMQKERPNATETYSAVLKACELIQTEHDARCERAVRAVALLREKYDWKARVAVETEEPEEFAPLSPMSPQHPLSPFNKLSPMPPVSSNTADEDMAMDTPGDNEGGDGDDSGDDDAELEEVLGPSLQPTPGASPL